RRKHDTTRGVVLLKCATRVRTYLYHENVADGEFGTYSEKRGSHSAAVGVRQFREIASSHENFRLRQSSAQFRIARERVHEAKMKGIRGGRGVGFGAPFGGRLRCSGEGVETAVACGHQHRDAPCSDRDVEARLVEAEQELRTRHSSSTQLVPIRGIDAHYKIFCAQGMNSIAQMWERCIRKTS